MNGDGRSCEIGTINVTGSKLAISENCQSQVGERKAMTITKEPDF